MSHKFLEIVHTRSLKGQSLERVYRKLKDKELLLAAYGKLYAKKGATTPGIDPQDTVDGMSLSRIEKIIKDLDKGTYKWKPVRRKEIAKRNGKLRPLGLPSWSNKLLQEVMRMILEAYYEPKFSNHSHAYRPNRGCHTALQEIQKNWRGVKWWIKIDIRGCFDNIDHTTLLDIIFKDIKDVRFRKLLSEMLKAGYMKDWEYHQTHSGTPQGGVISPILANIVLNELDQYVGRELVPEYSRGKQRRPNPEYRQCQHQIYRAKQRGDRETYQKLVAKRRTLPSNDNYDPNFRRLKYVRYADDILVGFTGPKTEAHQIKNKIRDFLQTLKLEMSEEKSLITHADKKIRFLNYHIHIVKDNTKVTRTKAGVVRRSINAQPILTVPYDVRKQWLKRYTQKGKPIQRPEIQDCSDYEIIKTYDLQLRGLVNYYTLASNVCRLSQVRYHLEQSLVKTLAAKYRTRVSKIYRKYRITGKHTKRCLSVMIPNPKNPDKPVQAIFGDIPIKRNKKATIIDQFVVVHKGHNELIKRLLTGECELCGSNRHIEVHHVRALKDVKKKYKGKRQPPEWAIFMMKRNRKTVVVCLDCHVAIHNGKYDGRRVE